MWFFEVVRIVVDAIVVCLIIVLLWSMAFGHNHQYVVAANKQIRYAFNSSNRKAFVQIFDADPAFEEAEHRIQIQARVERKLRESASLMQEYEQKVRHFEPSLTVGFSDYDSRMQLDNLIKSAQAHRDVFWKAHEVAKSCGFEVRPSIHDYIALAESDEPQEETPGKIIPMER